MSAAICLQRVYARHVYSDGVHLENVLFVVGLDGLIQSLRANVPADDSALASAAGKHAGDGGDASDGLIRAEVVTPGLVDIHNHGYGGSPNVYDFWAHPEVTQRVCAAHGVTSVLATLVFQSGEAAEQQRRTVVDVLRERIGRTGYGAVVEGIHAEGPIVRDCGGLPESDTQMPVERFEALLEAIPHLRIMTISPAQDEAVGYARIAALARRNIRVALGHDRSCTLDQISAAMRAARPHRTHITHLFNACSFSHREPSLVNVGLLRAWPPADARWSDLPLPTVEVIADGVHVHEMALHALLEAHERIACVSDAILDPDAGQTAVWYGQRGLELRHGAVYLRGTATLAGSCLTLDRVLHRLLHRHGLSPERAVRFVTAVPAAVADLPHVGALAVGRRADWVAWSPQWTVQRVFVAGRCVHNADAAAACAT